MIQRPAGAGTPARWWPPAAARDPFHGDAASCGSWWPKPGRPGAGARSRTSSRLQRASPRPSVQAGEVEAGVAASPGQREVAALAAECGRGAGLGFQPYGPALALPADGQQVDVAIGPGPRQHQVAVVAAQRRREAGLDLQPDRPALPLPPDRQEVDVTVGSGPRDDEVVVVAAQRGRGAGLGFQPYGLPLPLPPDRQEVDAT